MHSVEHYTAYTPHNITQRWMRWVGHLAYMGGPRNACKTVLEGTKLRGTGGRYGHMEEINIDLHLEKIRL